MTLQECLDRTIEQREKFAALPQEAIDLDVVMDWRNDSSPTDLTHTPCNSVGCVRGWVNTDLEARGILISAGPYLGLAEYPTRMSPCMFDGRANYDVDERTEGLDRYTQRIEELSALLK